MDRKEKALRLSGLIGRTVNCWLAGSVTAFLFGLIVFSPVIWYVLNIMDLESQYPEEGESLIVLLWALAAASTAVFTSALIPLLAGWLARPVSERLSGRKPTAKITALTLLGRFFPIALSWAFAVAVMWGPLVLLRTTLEQSTILSWIAMIVFAIFYTRLSLAAPAAALERPGLLGALLRSTSLTSGHRWTLFFFFLICTILWYGPMFVSSIFLETATTRWFIQQCAIMLVSTVVVGSFAAVGMAVAYHETRVRHEGHGSEELADVF